jgi:DNA repair exonuclease SbcCD ATPase subunit
MNLRELTGSLMFKVNSLTSFFFKMSTQIHFILNAGLRDYLKESTLTASHTRLDYSFPNEHLPEFMFTYYPLDTIKGFVDTLVRPCIEKLYLISTEYISEEYDRRWDVSSTITRAMTVLENSISTLRLRIIRTQDRVTHELRNYAMLHARRANYEMLKQKKIEVAALKAEVNQLATQLGNLQETLDGHVKEYIVAQRDIDSINTEMSTNTQEAERLLDQLSTFISRMPSYP